MRVPLYVICWNPVSLEVFFFFLHFIFNFCCFNYNVFGCSPLWLDSGWDSLCFLDLDIYFLSRLGKFSGVMSSDMFSDPFFLSSPSGTPLMWMLIYLMLLLRPFNFSFLLIIFYCFSNFHYAIFQLTDAFLCIIYSSADFFQSIFVCFSYCNFHLCLVLYIF